MVDTGNLEKTDKGKQELVSQELLRIMREKGTNFMPISEALGFRREFTEQVFNKPLEVPVFALLMVCKFLEVSIEMRTGVSGKMVSLGDDFVVEW